MSSNRMCSKVWSNPAQPGTGGPCIGLHNHAGQHIAADGTRWGLQQPPAPQLPPQPWQRMEPVTQLYHQGKPVPMPEGEAWFQNDTYIGSLRRVEQEQEDGEVLVLLHISFRRQDRTRATERDWRDTQRIKNDLVGPEQEMVELYPAESRIVDTADQYHLWGVEGIPLPFGWNVQFKLDADERPIEGTTQRAFE